MTPFAVLILAYNTRDLVANSLNRLCQPLRSRGVQIIVVDNASTDGVGQMIREQFPEVDLARSEHNRGFAGGNNLGLRRVRDDASAVILLNSDVIATPDTLVGLVEELHRRPEAGAISAGLMTTTGQPQAFAYGNDPTLSYLLRRALGTRLRLRPLHRWDVSEPIEVEWASGACLCVRAAAIHQVGELDERFFLYFEDNDWCRRMRQAGWRIIYHPGYRVIHLGGASQPERRQANTLYYQSLIAFYAKHYGPLPTAILRALLAVYRQTAAL